jgi:hypothetical protein
MKLLLFLLKNKTNDVGNTQAPDYWNNQIIGCQSKGILEHLYSLWSEFDISEHPYVMLGAGWSIGSYKC